MADQGDVTLLLEAIGEGDPDARDRLFHLVYEELHALAKMQRGRWDGNRTLNTTALVHEAYLKLVRQEEAQWEDRRHFFRVAARAMRHVLVNYARDQKAAKRGGDALRVPLDRVNPVAEDAADEVIAINDLLEQLEQKHARQRQVVECRFFAGLSVKETADVLGISASTVKRDWRFASAWLRRALQA